MPIAHMTLEGDKIVGKTHKKPILKILLGFLLVFVLTLSLLTVYFYPRVKTVARDLSTVSSQAKVLETAVREQDVPKAKASAATLRVSLQKSEGDLAKLGIVGKLPFVNGYYKDATHALKAAELGTQAGELIADSILPFGDILGLKGVKSDLKAEEKVEVLVTKVFPSLSKRAVDLQRIVREIKVEVDQIGIERYPEDFTVKGYKVHESLAKVKDALNQTEIFFPSFKNALDVIPSALGYQQEKTYLIWFQNDKELRPSGGFLTAYGVAKIKNGKLLDIESEDIYQLDSKFVPFEQPPPPLKKYLLLQIFPIRDANLSPDFKLSAQKFESFYARIPNVPKVDGILAMDTEAVRKFLEFTGPVKTKKYHETFSAEINKKYNIPDVVYKMELYAEKLMVGSTERKGIVGDLMDSMLEKILSAPPEKFPAILDTFRTVADQKNVLFYFHDSKAQGLVEQLNYAGRIKDYSGDYLHVNNANFAGLKGNLYIRAAVDQDITIADDGTVKKKMTVTLRNIEKADGWLNSIYQNWMRVYVPAGSKLLDKKVFADFVESKDLGKTVWESFSRTYPLKSSETTFTYQLPFKIKKGDTYRFLIQKQPGTTDPHMIIRVNGKKMFEFDLKKDTDIEFKV